MVEVTEEMREFVRAELRNIADILRKRYGIDIPQIQKLMQEMLTVSI